MHNSLLGFSLSSSRSLLSSLIFLGGIATTLHANANECPSCGVSKASTTISQGAGVIVAGSASMLVGSGQVVIESVVATGETVTLVLKAAANASKATVQLSGKGIERALLVTGAVVEVSVETTGYLLVSAGKVIAFIPNELGNALVHHARAP